MSDEDFDAADLALRSRVSNLDASENANILAQEAALEQFEPPSRARIRRFEPPKLHTWLNQ